MMNCVPRKWLHIDNYQPAAGQRVFYIDTIDYKCAQQYGLDDDSIGSGVYVGDHRVEFWEDSPHVEIALWYPLPELS